MIQHLLSGIDAKRRKTDLDYGGWRAGRSTARDTASPRPSHSKIQYATKEFVSKPEPVGVDIVAFTIRRHPSAVEEDMRGIHSGGKPGLQGSRTSNRRILLVLVTTRFIPTKSPGGPGALVPRSQADAKGCGESAC